MFDRLSQYRIMWILVFFDLPTETKRDKRNYRQFVDRLEKNGFNRFQWSIFLRHCPSRENMMVHIKRVKSFLPPKGHIAILHITDRQFGMMELFVSRKKKSYPKCPSNWNYFELKKAEKRTF